MALPVLVVFGSLPSGLISAFIIFIGMRQAWKMTGALVVRVAGPYRVGASAAPPRDADVLRIVRHGALAGRPGMSGVCGARAFRAAETARGRRRGRDARGRRGRRAKSLDGSAGVAAGRVAAARGYSGSDR